MAPWPNTYMMGTNLVTDFETLNDILGTADAEDPDVTFLPFAAFSDNIDGSRSGLGFPKAVWKWSGREDLKLELLHDFWNDALSVELYIRTRTNRVDGSGNYIFRTFLCQALWIEREEDKQAGYTLDVELSFRHLVIQEEAV